MSGWDNPMEKIRDLERELWRLKRERCRVCGEPFVPESDDSA